MASNDWNHLASTPREFSRSLEIRLALSQLSPAHGLILVFAAVWIIAGSVFIFLGGGFPFFLIGIALILVGLAILAGGVLYIKKQIAKVKRILTHGEFANGTITQVMDRSVGRYRPFADVAAHWRKLFGKGSAYSGFQNLVTQFKNWPVRVSLSTDPEAEIEAKLDLGNRLMDTSPEANQVRFLLERDQGSPRLLVADDFAWLKLDASGSFKENRDDKSSSSSLLRSLARSILVVVPTYLLAVIGMTYGTEPLFGPVGVDGIPVVLGAGVVLLFTLTHGVVPVFFYSFFSRGFDVAKQVGKGAFPAPAMMFAQGFILLHMGFWYGLPILGLALMTGWFNMAWVVLHVAMAGKGRRKWAFLEHGSTSMALFLYLVCFSGTSLFPFGIVVVLFQSLLLTLVDWKAKGLWIKEPDGPTDSIMPTV